MWSNLNDPCIFREISQRLKLAHFCGENSRVPLAVPRVVDAWHFAWLNSDLRRVKRNHPEKVPASLEDPQNNKTHGFFPQEIAIDRGYPRGSFHLKIREVREVRAAVGSNWVLEILFQLRGQGLHVPTATLLTCQKKVKRKATTSGSCTTLSEKEMLKKKIKKLIKLCQFEKHGTNI